MRSEDDLNRLRAEQRRRRQHFAAQREQRDRQAQTTIEAPLQTKCEACGRGPAIVLKLRSTGGYVVYRTMKSSRPVALCKECGLEALHHSQKVAGVGVATLNFMAPYALAQNQKWIMRLKQLPDPQTDAASIPPNFDGFVQ